MFARGTLAAIIVKTPRISGFLASNEVASGPRGRRFKSCRPDYFSKRALRQARRRAFSLWDKSYVVERPVQTDDFEDSTFCGVIGRKPFRSKVLRKFKRFDRDIGGFVPLPVGSVDLET